MKLVVVVRCIVFVLSPIESKPFDIRLDGVYVFHVLLGRVRIVQPEVAYSVVFLGKSKIKADALDVSNVKVSVWLRWEPCYYRVVWNPSVGQIVFDDLFNEVERRLFL